MSDHDKVVDFNLAAEQPVLSVPEAFNKEEVSFLVKMMLDEIMELYATVADPQEAKYSMVKMITDSKDIPQISSDENLIIAEQADALVDCYYYSLNAAIKKGINLSEVFNIVHESNMTKKNSETNKFERRSDGKIIKPPNFKAPDILGYIISKRSCV